MVVLRAGFSNINLYRAQVTLLTFEFLDVEYDNYVVIYFCTFSWVTQI